MSSRIDAPYPLYFTAPTGGSYVHIRGRGPCEWAQPPSWPCSEADLEASFFPEASETFREAVRAALAAVAALGEKGAEK